MNYDTKSRTQHAVCPVTHFHADAWKGWHIVGKETVEHPAGVLAWGGSRFSREPSSGKGWEVFHLRRQM